MKSLPPRFRSLRAFSLTEILICATAFSFVLGALMMSFVSFNRSFALSRDYAMARLLLSDYLSMDLRRSSGFQPTLVRNVTRGNWTVDDWTLPCAIIVPTFYGADGKTPNQPARVTLTTAEWDARKAEALARGKLPPPTWDVSYGVAAAPRMVVYQQEGDRVVRREGNGNVTPQADGSITWTWSGTTPLSVPVAQGVIEVRGVYRTVADLTPEDLTEIAPDNVITHFKGNYTIRYLPSRLSRATPQPGTTISSNILLRGQFYSF